MLGTVGDDHLYAVLDALRANDVQALMAPSMAWRRAACPSSRRCRPWPACCTASRWPNSRRRHRRRVRGRAAGALRRGLRRRVPPTGLPDRHPRDELPWLPTGPPVFSMTCCACSPSARPAGRPRRRAGGGWRWRWPGRCRPRRWPACARLRRRRCRPRLPLLQRLPPSGAGCCAARPGGGRPGRCGLRPSPSPSRTRRTSPPAVVEPPAAPDPPPPVRPQWRRRRRSGPSPTTAAACRPGKTCRRGRERLHPPAGAPGATAGAAPAAPSGVHGPERSAPEAAAPAPEAPAAEVPATAPDAGEPLPTTLDWHALQEQIGLGGLNLQLAQHCELAVVEGRLIKLRLASDQRHLLQINRSGPTSSGGPRPISGPGAGGHQWARSPPSPRPSATRPKGRAPRGGGRRPEQDPSCVSSSRASTRPSDRVGQTPDFVCLSPNPIRRTAP